MAQKKAKLSAINDFAIEWWDVERPKDYPLNARKWKPAAVVKVAASIKAYGWRQPIVVDDAGVIVIGHLRRAAARQAGLAQVPVHVAAGLSPEAIRGLRLADNRSHDEAEWDMDLLAREFGELKALNFDLRATGFDLLQVDSYLRGVNFTAATEADQGRLDQKKPTKCPECGHEFTP
jgi:ParB-like chromosome segregation protein Spo0J